MFVKKIVFAAVLAASAYAQDSSTPTDTATGVLPTASLTPCITNCATSATQCVFTDTTCVCSNTEYQSAVAACLVANCTPDEVQTAQDIQASLCGSTSSVSPLPSSSLSSILSGVSSSLSSRVSSASSRLSSLSSSRSSATSSPTSTAGGSGGAAGLSASLLATGGAVLLGVIGGGLLVF